MIFLGDDYDPAMRYEGLMRAIFNDCRKYGDPWGYAAQDAYGNFVPEPNFDGKRALATAFIKLIIENPSSIYLERLKEIEESIWEIKSQKEAIAIIDEGISIVNKIIEK